jgi:hypothetical protein
MKACREVQLAIRPLQYGFAAQFGCVCSSAFMGRNGSDPWALMETAGSFSSVSCKGMGFSQGIFCGRTYLWALNTKS